MGFLMDLRSEVRSFPLTESLLSLPQYQELQVSAQLHGDCMKETKVQITQLQQAIQKLLSQIENLKKQVRVPEPPSPVSHCL